MYPFKKILIALNLIKPDESILKYVSMIIKLFDVEEVIFINVIKNITIPNEILKEFPKLLESGVEEREAKISEKIAKYFPQPNFITKVLVKKGKIAKVILNTTDEYDIDLIILGRSSQKGPPPLLAQRLARQANCSLLIVPDKCKVELDKILVLSDFSDYANYSMEKAIQLASKSDKKIDIFCQNVYVVPVGYHYTGKNYNEFAKVMEGNAKKEFEKFLKKIDSKGVEIKPIYSLSKEEYRVETFYKLAKKISPGLIMFGARGLTKTSNFLIGSNAEKMVQLDTDFPLAFIRRKNDRAGLIAYFRSL